jgi:secondary thiamine-phosphate synthase enzyme
VIGQLSGITSTRPELIASASLVVETRGQEFVEITREVAKFVTQIGADSGALLMFLRHTSASLLIQENADVTVRKDLTTALSRLAPVGGGWTHEVEGADDMPAHVKAALTGISLHVPVIERALALGTWQGIYVVEHRRRPHRREVMLQFIGSKHR